MSGKTNGKLSLRDAAARTPPIDNPVEAMRRNLSLALFDSVKEGDILELANKIKAQAMAGDLKAARLYLELILGKERQPMPAAGEAKLASVLQDLVDEIRIARAHSGEPRMRKELEGLGRRTDDDEE